MTFKQHENHNKKAVVHMYNCFFALVLNY